MISSLELSYYRGFERYKLDGMTNVNLLVGANNCGKTSVLEAVSLLAGNNKAGEMAKIANRRGETIAIDDPDGRFPPDLYTNLAHFFYGHSFDLGDTFSIRSEGGEGDLHATIGQYSSDEPNGNSPPDHPDMFDEDEVLRDQLVIRFTGEAAARGRTRTTFQVTAEGAMLIGPIRHARRRWAFGPSLGESAQHISPESLQPGHMSELWDKVIFDGREEEVIAALRILDPKITGVYFLSGERSRFYPGGTGAVLGFRNQKRRVPLGSHGEGMRRLLALSISLIGSSKGISW